MDLSKASERIHFLYQFCCVAAYGLPTTDQYLVFLPKNSYFYYTQTFVYVTFFVISETYHMYYAIKIMSLVNLSNYLETIVRTWDSVTAVVIILFNLRARKNVIRIYNKIIKFDQQLKKHSNLSYKKLQTLTWFQIAFVFVINIDGLFVVTEYDTVLDIIMYFFRTYITMTIIFFVLYQHFNFTYLLYQRYSILNNLTETTNDIDFLMHSYKKLLTVTYLVHETYEIQAFFCIICRILWLTINFYNATIVFYKNPKYNIDIMEPLYTYICWSLCDAFSLSSIAILNYITIHAADKFVPLLCSMLTKLKGEKIVSRYNLFCTRYVNNKINFKFLDLFELNLSMIISVFAAISYYVTLLIGYDI